MFFPFMEYHRNAFEVTTGSGHSILSPLLRVPIHWKLVMFVVEQ